MKNSVPILLILIFLSCTKNEVGSPDPVTPMLSCADRVNVVSRSEVVKLSEQGRIICQNGIPVNGVMVTITDLSTNRTFNTQSDQNGNYHSIELIKGNSYRVTFNYRDDRSITLNELRIAQCGIEGNIELDPIQKIAADFDLSNSLSVLDLLAMRKANVEVESTPWVFVDESSTSVLQDGYLIENYQGGIWTRDLVAVKKGDVARRFCE